jgi:hypothetical protein
LLDCFLFNGGHAPFSMAGFRHCVVEVVMNVYVTFSVVDIFCMVFPHSICIEWFYFDYSLDGNGQSKTEKNV